MMIAIRQASCAVFVVYLAGLAGAAKLTANEGAADSALPQEASPSTTPPVDSKQMAQIKFEDHAHDFGSVYRGQTLTHRFRFTNVGRAPLSIQGVHAACGCTAVELEEAGRAYKPGEAGFIEVKLDTRDFAGPMAKTITIMTNERQVPDRLLTIKAFVKTDLEASPPLADLGNVYTKLGAKTQIRLRALDGSTPDIKELVFNRQTIDANVTRDGKDWLLEIKLKPGIPAGFVKETVLVKNNSSRFLKELPVPVRATVHGNIDIMPNYLEFGAIEPNQGAQRQVSLKGVQGFNLKGARADVLLNGRKVAQPEKFLTINGLNETSGTDRRQLSIELKNNSQLAGSVHGKLYVATNDPEQKELEVDFYAFFR